jgi:hypothetical protein
MKRQSDTMLTIDAATGKVIAETELHGMPDRGTSSYTNGDFEPDGDTYIIASDPQRPAVRVNVAANPPTITKLNPPGGGGWYDWAYHPKDGRLYAVDGDNGSLILIDQSANPLKQVLAQGCFPKAEGHTSGERGLYSAVFFTTAGHLYAVDTAGNVNKLDLTASTPSKPVTGDDLRGVQSSRVGGGKLKLDGLQVQDSAGQVLDQKLKEQYDWIDVTIALMNGHPDASDEPMPGWELNYRLTLTARHTDVHRWRVTFEKPANWLIKSWGTDIKIDFDEGDQAYDHAYIEPKEEGLIPAGQSQDFYFGLWVATRELRHPQAVRVS